MAGTSRGGGARNTQNTRRVPTVKKPGILDTIESFGNKVGSKFYDLIEGNARGTSRRGPRRIRPR